MMLKYDVLNRFTGKVQFTADIDCDADAARGVKLGLAVKWALTNGGDLSGCNLRDSDLRYSDLSGSDLSGSDLRGSNLRDSNLSYSNLRGSNLVHCGSRSDGYEFYAHIRDGKIWIKAGCRYFTISDAAKHWRDTRAGEQLGDESQQLLKNARALVKIRKLME